MSILGLSASKPSEVSVGFRRGWLRHVRVAFASAGYLAVIILAIELLQREPDQGFGLLREWGPWPIIVFVFVCILGGFLSSVNETIRVSFSSLVESVKDVARAQTQLAENTGRGHDEVRRLAIYAAREFPGVYERLDKVDDVLREIAESVHDVKGHLKKGNAGNGYRS